MDVTDPAKAALERSENDWTFLYNLHDDVPLAPEVRRALAAENLRLIRLALGRTVEPDERTAWEKLPPDFQEEFLAMSSEMAVAKQGGVHPHASPGVQPCECGYPEKPCLRIMLRNGPSFPSRPCEPVPS